MSEEKEKAGAEPEPEEKKSAPPAEDSSERVSSSDGQEKESSPTIASASGEVSGEAEDDDYFYPRDPELRFLHICEEFDKVLDAELKRLDHPHGTRLPTFFRSTRGELASLVAFLRKEVYAKK